MSFRRTRAMARKEFLHIVRDPLSLAMAIAVPLMMLLLFGYALSLDVDRIPLAISDSDHSVASRDLIARFEGSRFFRIVSYAEDSREIERAMDHGKALLAVDIPRGFADLLARDRPSPIQLVLDGSDSNTASIALGYAQAMLAEYSEELRHAALDRRGGGKMSPAVDPVIRIWYNPQLQSKNYIVPGLIAIILMVIAALLTSLTIAREYELGNLELLLSTPVRPAEIVLGKMAAFFTLGITDAAVAVIVGVFIFDVPLRGSILELGFITCLFLFGALCWGLFVSATARSQLLAYQIGVLSSFLPAFLLSGFVYAVENMPSVIEAITHVVPARYFVSLLKGLFLKGVSIWTMGADVAFLFLYAALVFVGATWQLRRKLA